jgi:hypothetical protein
MGEIFMAARLATEYKHFELDLDDQQLEEFMLLLRSFGFKTKARIFENGDSGDAEISLYDHGQEIPFMFKKVGNHYKIEGSALTIKDWNLAHTLQKALRQFHGHALAHRIFVGHRVEYYYRHGKVVHIKELQNGEEKLIYQYKDLMLELKYMLADQNIEQRILVLKQQVDHLLDQRNQLINGQTETIDNQLRKLSKQLFILEA